jgi:hypothetical protein
MLCVHEAGVPQFKKKRIPGPMARWKDKRQMASLR